MKIGLKKTLERFKRAKRIVITTHRDPDGDALGSALAVSRWLKAGGAGKKESVKIILPSEPAAFLSEFFKKSEVSVFESSRHRRYLERVDLVVACDLADLSRLALMADIIDAQKLLILDHHDWLPPRDVAHLIDAASPSTTSLVDKLIRQSKYKFTGSVAEAIYLGLLSDTGGLMGRETGSETCRMAARLFEAGVDAETVHKRLYRRYDYGHYQVMADALRRIRCFHKGQVAVMSVPASLLKKLKMQPVEIFFLADMTLGLAGTRLGILLVDLPRNKVKLSFRCGEKDSVQALATHYGGGGHKYAAGAVLKGDLLKIEKHIVDDARRWLRGHKFIPFSHGIDDENR